MQIPSHAHPTTADFVRNTLANCAGYLVLVLAGFIIPRLIDRHLGQEQLGIWDFAWATVSYLHMLSVGMQGSVAPFVSGYRAQARWDALNATVNSCLAATTAAGLLALVLALILAVRLPSVMKGQWTPYVSEVQLLVLLLGACVAMEAPSSVFRGVIGGHHRYGVASAIDAAVNAFRLAFLAFFLKIGGGLSALAWTTLGCALASLVARAVVAHRVCQELRLDFRAVHWRYGWEAARFGIKSTLINMARILMYQTSNVLIMMFLGPGALAIYARGAALLNHANAFSIEFGRAFNPAAASLQAASHRDALARLHLSAARYGLCLALPIIAVLTIMGGPLLRVWMGPDYEVPKVLIVLAVGHLGLLAQQPAVLMLIGMGKHGSLAIAALVSALTVCTLVFIFLGVLQWGLVGVAAATGIPLTLLHIVFVPYYVRRLTGISLQTYVSHIVPRPLVAVLPFAACLWCSRIVREPQSLVELGAELVIAGLVLAASYWRLIVPDSARSNVRARIMRFCRR